MTIAVYPGTFDPMTSGHQDLVRRASNIFAKVYVAVAQSVGKHPLLTLEERFYCAKLVCADYANVEVLPFTGLLKDFVRTHGVNVIVRGARAVSDFEYEFQMTAANYRLNDSIETVFIMSPPQYMYLSSSIVREIASFHGNISELVTPGVEKALRARFSC